jgi:hypothetical protein
MKAPTPYQLQVSPLPADRFNDGQEATNRVMDGFVDDDVIASIITGPVSSRPSPRTSDLVLSSDENDFAGWAVPSVSPFRIIAEKQEMAAAIPQHGESEPGLGQPHRGQHRWWVAAAASVASALIFSMLFAGLAYRSGEAGGVSSAISGSVVALQSALGSLAP